jgi:hypothetical protein
MQDLKWKNKLGVLVKFIIFNIWFFCDARLLPNAMTYLLKTFTWHNKFCTFFCHSCFVGSLRFHWNLLIAIYLKVLQSKYSYFNSKTYLSSLKLCWTQKMGINGVLKNCSISFKFTRCFVCNCKYTFTSLFCILITPILNGNKLGTCMILMLG